MASVVAHGPHPKWPKRARTETRRTPRPWKLTPATYRCLIQGHYTDTDTLTAVGVRMVRWQSKRAIKRRAELLGLRTAFVCWFLASYTDLGGSWAAAVRELRDFPQRRYRRIIRAERRMHFLG